MRGVRARLNVAAGAMLVASTAVAMACATGGDPVDLTPTNEAGFLDVARKEVTPVPPEDTGSSGSSGGDDSSTSSGGPDSSSGGCTGADRKIVVNELQSGGATPSDEFIELFNAGACDVAMGGWQLLHRSAADGKPGTNIKTFPAGEMLTTAAPYLLLATTSFGGTPKYTYTATLAAGGGQVGLVDDKGATIDAVGYGSVVAGASFTEKSAAPAPPPSQSIARTPNGTDSDDNSKDFKIATPTPGAPN